MLDRIDSRELSEWMAFHNLEPFGDDWRRSGLTTAAVYNVNITKGKRLSAEDFMPIVKRAVKATAASIRNAIGRYAKGKPPNIERQALPPPRSKGGIS